jgi:apolipoprotein D and lipocalin family protein
MRQLSLAPLLALVLALAACNPQPDEVLRSFRNADVQIASQAALDPARLAGRWHEVAGFYDPAASGCALGLAKLTPLKSGRLRVTLSECAGLGPRTVIARPGRHPGRYRVSLPGRLGDPWWILWVDQDYRAMVVGTPSGSFGAILGRSPHLRRDLYVAARRILDFNGYDPRQLHLVMR